MKIRLWDTRITFFTEMIPQPPDIRVKTELSRQNDHPFVKSPHKTLVCMSLPVLLSLVAEPLTGLVDTGFVARLGAEPLAALGAGTVALSIIFWVFNFLGIGSQTQVAQACGRTELKRAAEIGGLAMVLSAAIGGLIILGGLPLTAFFIFTTRAATRIGPDAGAAHQAIRQMWVFTALFLDAYAISGQSLIGFFMGPGRLEQARRVARLVCLWSLATGVVLSAAMWLGQDFVVGLLLPPSAAGIFFAAWLMALIFQPINALAFATDGIHWGTGDFRFLRNVMISATAFGAIAVYLLDETVSGALTRIWIITGCWITIRAGFGVSRIWPGIGKSPLKRGYED